MVVVVDGDERWRKVVGVGGDVEVVVMEVVVT